MGQTLFIGKIQLEYERLDSTNSQAERLLKQGQLAEGTVISTSEQWAGRGQMGNSWFSDIHKNIALSIVLYPKIRVQEQFLLNQVIALGIRDCVQHFIPNKTWIKWPNDILVQGKKVCGVLIQNVISRYCISQSIVGVGMNINQASFPDGLRQPTSFFLETGLEYDLKTIQEYLYFSIEKYYLQLKAGKMDNIQRSYHDFLYQKNEWQYYKDKEGNVFLGRILGVSLDGMLNVETKNGIVQSFMFKEIQGI